MAKRYETRELEQLRAKYETTLKLCEYQIEINDTYKATKLLRELGEINLKITLLEQKMKRNRNREKY